MTRQTTQDLQEEIDRFVLGDEGVARHDLFERLRQHAPVVWSSALDAWVVSRYGDVKAVLEDEDRFATLKSGPGAPVFGDAILQWRGREHQKKGGIVARRLRSKRGVEATEAYVQEVAARMAGDLEAKAGPVDLKDDYAMWIPLLVISDLMGVDGADRFRTWYRDISAGGVSSIGHPDKRRRAFEALDGLRAFLTPIIDARRDAPGDDLLSDLCTATYDDEPLPSHQILAMAAFLLTAGVETTERVLSSLFVHLTEHPDLWDRLHQHPELVTPACAEALRVFPPVHGVTRQALEDVELGGQSIEEGSRLLVLLASANRDESVFDDPHSYQLDRFADDAERQFTNAGRIMPFGAGRHHCTGSQLARVEMVHALTELITRFEGATFADGRPGNDGFLLVSPPNVRVELRSRR